MPWAGKKVPIFSFVLSADFVEDYRSRKVSWGFTDAGGNSFSELTLLDKYSRVKEDGSKETWPEICERVTNGTYSIQKNHAKENRLPWNDRKAQASAQEFYERLFTFKFTPPGRGLWVMGTDLVNVQRNSAALQNPLRGSTRIVTRDGVQTLEEIVGGVVEVWADGEWHKAFVNDMGVQPVQRIAFKQAGRSNLVHQEVATPDHGWVLRDGTKTHHLRVGDRVAAAAAESRDEHYVDGFKAGLIFGDGSVNYRYKNGDISHMMRLCGAKAQYAPLFDNVQMQPNCKGDPVVYYRHERNLKELPPAETSAGWAIGFIDGWKAADGSSSRSGWYIHTQNADAAQWLIDNAALGGYIATGHTVDNRPTNFGPRSAPLHGIRLARPYDRYWTVESIEALPDPEQVYCLVVPTVAAFTLASGIVSSNCAMVSTKGMSRNNPAAPFAFLMEASMLGVGVGFDTLGAKKGYTFAEVVVHGTAPLVYGADGRALPPTARLREGRLENLRGVPVHVIPDTREGWVEAMALVVNTFLKGGEIPVFDFSLIRPAGEPIKGFGGTAAGPAPLFELVVRLTNLFTGRAGTALTSTDVTDIANIIGVCVVSGNVRRSAELALGEDDDESFFRLKDSTAFPQRNHQCPMDETWTKVLPHDCPGAGWGYMSNNSISAKIGTDYGKYAGNIALNGEPGLVWLDTARRYGRLIDGVQEVIDDVDGVNPCHTGSVRLLTKEYGLARFDFLSGKRFTVWNGEQWSSSHAWHSGVKPAYRVTLVNGQWIELTEDHVVEVLTAGDDKGHGSTPMSMKVSELKPGQKIRALRGDGSWDGEPVGFDVNTAVLYGLLLGDGWTDKSGVTVYIKNSEPEVARFLTEYGEAYGFAWKRDGDLFKLYDLHRQMDKHGFSLQATLPKRTLPEAVFAMPPHIVRGLLKGLFSANGGAMPKHARVDLKTTCRELADQVQLLLLALGYSPYITTNAATAVTWSNGTYTSRESYDVNVGSSHSYDKFQTEIGFLHAHKSVRIPVGPERQPKSTKVKSVEYIGELDVYDFTEPLIHWGMANGIKSHNCAEQQLEGGKNGQGECCTLVETYLPRHESLEDFKRTLKFAYLYAKTVTLLPTHWEETNAIMQRNRRIGTSVSGVAEFADTHGMSELKTWFDEGYQTIRRYDRTYSAWLCVRESIRVTTVKPSGTVSLLAGVTPGVHWMPGGEYYLRSQRFDRNSPLVPLMRMAGYRVEDDVNDSRRVVIYSPIHHAGARPQNAVSMWEKAMMAVTAQRYWSDNAVSVTVTFDPDTEAQHIGSLLHALEGQLKTVSFLRIDNGTYAQMPYTEITREEYEAYAMRLMPVDFSVMYLPEHAREAAGEAYCTTDSCLVERPDAPAVVA